MTRYNNIQIFGNPCTCFGLFRPYSRRFSAKKKIELLSEDGLKRPKHVGGLPNICILLYLFIVLLLIHIYYGFETCSLLLRE